MTTQKKIKETERLPNVHPGEILETELIEPMGLTQQQVADRAGLPVSRINDLIKGRRGITVDSAIRLGLAFGMSPEMWIKLQWAHDREEAYRESASEYKAIKPFKSTERAA